MKMCSIEGCNEKQVAKGYCKRHYKRFNEYGDPLAPLKRKQTSKRVTLPYEQNHKYIDNTEYKLCLECNEWFPMNKEYFYKNKSSKIDGFNPYCKECTKKKNLKYRNDNIEQSRNRTYNHFLENKATYNNRRNAWRNENKEHDKMYQKKYRKENADYFNWYSTERRLYKKHEIPDEQWENCKNYFNYRCAYCGLPIEEHYITYRGKVILGDFHKDHVDDEGANDLSNCIPACKSCNSSKGIQSMEEWFRSKDFFKEEYLIKIYKWLHDDFKKI